MPAGLFAFFNHPNHKGETMNRDILEKPFGPEQIKQREGNFGKKLDYIEGHAVIQRLNDAFDGDWSFTLTHHEILKDTDEVIVIGQLNAGGIVKSQFGSSRITRAKETGDIISLADDLKAATTDALKKAATLLGVGLHLYRNERPQGGNRNGTVFPPGETVTEAMVPARTVPKQRQWEW
jgi:recombination DNA repair RAD52 pathway protein